MRSRIKRERKQIIIRTSINEISKQVWLSWQVEEYNGFEYNDEITAILFEKYKLNKYWIEYTKNHSYEIIDIGYKLKILNESPFYNMEKDILDFK